MPCMSMYSFPIYTNSLFTKINYCFHFIQVRYIIFGIFLIKRFTKYFDVFITIILIYSYIIRLPINIDNLYGEQCVNNLQVDTWQILLGNRHRNCFYHKPPTPIDAQWPYIRMRPKSMPLVVGSSNKSDWREL